MRFLWFSDAHVSDTPPSMRHVGYTDEIFTKLTEVAEIANNEDVDYVLFGGDWFHSKHSSRISHTLVNRSLRLLDKFNQPILWIVGSHDIPYGRVDLMDKRPIGTLLRHPKVTYVEGRVDEITTDKNPRSGIALLPVSDTHIDLADVVVQFKEMHSRKNPDDFEIAMLHAPIVRGGSFPYATINSADLVGLADLVIWGHMHDPEGVWEEGGTVFANVGSIARGAIDEMKTARTPQVLLFEVYEHEFEYEIRKLKSARPACDVFRVAEKQAALDREEDIEALLTSVRTTEFAAFSVESAAARLRGMTYADREERTPAENAAASARFAVVTETAASLLESHV